MEQKVYKKNGLLHREDGPAVSFNDGSHYWYNEGKLHRIGGPAIESDVFREWYEDGILHRIGGPAIEKSYIGNKFVKNQWYLHGRKMSSIDEYWDLLSEEDKLKCLMSKDFFTYKEEK